MWLKQKETWKRGKGGQELLGQNDSMQLSRDSARRRHVLNS